MGVRCGKPPNRYYPNADVNATARRARTHDIKVPVTAYEKEAIAAYANAHEVSVAALARRLLLDLVRYTPVYVADYSTMFAGAPLLQVAGVAVPLTWDDAPSGNTLLRAAPYYTPGMCPLFEDPSRSPATSLEDYCEGAGDHMLMRDGLALVKLSVLFRLTEHNGHRPKRLAIYVDTRNNVSWRVD